MGDSSCELAYDAAYAEDALELASEARKKEIRRAEEGPLERLVEGKVFSAECADFRTGIEALAEVYKGLGAGGKRDALLDRAIAYLERKAADVGEDRNRDDNLRFFLELRGSSEKLKELFPRLIAAYPSDYVYSQRFAKYLAEKGEFAAALPWSEKAERLCYGANRLAVTKVKAKILAGLGRKDEALAILKRDIKAGGKAFAKDAAGLEALLKELSSP